MQSDHFLTLLVKARGVLEHHLFEENGSIRDDVAEVCMAIDHAVPPTQRIEQARGEAEEQLLQRPVAA